MTTEEQKSQEEKLPPNTDQKLWAGKYKTPEDMETALLEQNKEIYKMIDERKSLKTQVEQVTTIPSDYKTPDGLELIKGEIDGLKLMAKNSGLSQSHYEKLVSEINTKRKAENETYEETKKSIGDETVTVLTDYVKKFYPEVLHETVLSKLITEPEARKQAMSDRDKRLNSSAAGMDKAHGLGGQQEAYEGQKEMQKIAEEYLKNPSNSKVKDKLISLAADVGHARQDK